MLEATTTPKIIHPYFRTSGYAHIHVPNELAKQCGITSGNKTTFIAYVEDGMLVIKQTKEDKYVR